jgi:hypothetical protein
VNLNKFFPSVNTVIDLVPDTSVQWSSDRDLIGEVRTMKGRGTFFYKLFEGALKNVTSSLHADFIGIFMQNW